MKKKKEIEIPKTEYIYQRYNGIITKYIVDEEYYTDVKTGIATKKDETILLGKISENIIDLIEVGDILELKEGNSICYLGLRKNQITVNYLDLIESIKNKDCKLLSILTHEQYEANCYKVIRKKESK